MYFVNETSEAVTERDRTQLRNVCVALRAMCFIGARQSEIIHHWKLHCMECHSVVRMLSLIYRDLRPVDGFLVGLELGDDGLATIVHTDHSWLQTQDGAIIDPYPMGILSSTSAILVPTKGTRYCVHGSNYYHEDARVRRRFDSADCWRRARSVVRAVKKHLKKEDMAEVCISTI